MGCGGCRDGILARRLPSEAFAEAGPAIPSGRWPTTLRSHRPMTDRRPVVVLAANRDVRERDATASELSRLEAIADFRYAEFDRPTSWDEPPPPDADEDRRLIAEIGDADALIVCHG